MFKKISEKTDRSLFFETGLHLAGDRELVVENCRRIEECSDVYVSLVSRRLLVQVWGSGLRVSDYRTGGLVIRGKIAKIELTERRR